MAPYLLIVCRGRLGLYHELEAMYEGSGRVDVILDRRRTPDRRRGRGVWAGPERRQGERRQRRPEVEEHLRVLGWALVRRAPP
jgi:hypothetical protein